ncbi:hypothetical protein DPMN_058519 [Dreissena polymorpha]|uniref:Uncharacterized protein n=1 Tax=Dreissena polymorpha TaxID=45954 RepID=A0A9D4HG72_DREPO|nr:hypothetical protein DPMN_058519 [Dreissena polymorpha]
MVVVVGGGKAVWDDDYDYDKDCNADTDNSDDDNGDHEWISIPPQTKFMGHIGVSFSVGPSVCVRSLIIPPQTKGGI